MLEACGFVYYNFAFSSIGIPGDLSCSSLKSKKRKAALACSLLLHVDYIRLDYTTQLQRNNNN